MKSVLCTSLKEDEDIAHLRRMLKSHVNHASKMSEAGYFDYYSVHEFCRFLSIEDGILSSQKIQICVDVLVEFVEMFITSSDTDWLLKRLQVFDLLVVNLFHSKCVKDNLELFVSLFGDRILQRWLCTEVELTKFRMMNLEMILCECFMSWKSFLGEQMFREMSACGWSALDRCLLRNGGTMRDNATPRAASALAPCGVYDFIQIMLSVESSESVSLCQISYVRYLVSERVFASTVHRIAVHYCSMVDSAVDSRISPCGIQNLFSKMCLIFFNSFGVSLMTQISNDLIGSLLSPPSDFLRLLISRVVPASGSPECLSALSKYLVTVFVSSIHRVVQTLRSRDSAEGEAFAFLLKAELVMMQKCGDRSLHAEDMESKKHAVSDDVFSVVNSLVSGSLSFTINELQLQVDQLERGNAISKWITNRNRIARSKQIINWLRFFSTDMLALGSLLGGQSDRLKSIYREGASAEWPPAVDSIPEWEKYLSDRVLSCKRYVTSDLESLLATARAQGCVLRSMDKKQYHGRSIENPVSDEAPRVAGQKEFRFMTELREEMKSVKKHEDTLMLQVAKLKAELNERDNHTEILHQVQILKEHNNALFLEMSKLKLEVVKGKEMCDDVPPLPEYEPDDVIEESPSVYQEKLFAR